jgi:hypothetical protein
MAVPKSSLGLFNDNLIRFFEDLGETYPEERDIKTAMEALKGARKINPRLILDMFVEYVTTPLRDAILEQREEEVITFAKATIQNQYNDMLTALMIFDKHYPTMPEEERKKLWKWLKVLVILSERAKA